VFARAIDGGTLYVNTTTDSKQIAIDTPSVSALSHERYLKQIELRPYGVDLVTH
jgi:beta-galactosidase